MRGLSAPEPGDTRRQVPNAKGGEVARVLASLQPST